MKEIFKGENAISEEVWKDLLSDVDENKDFSVDYFEKIIII